MRRAFKLPEVDEEFLNSLGKPWEAILDGRAQWVILSEFAVPAGYNQSVVSVALRIPPTYPDAQIDMAYFLPHLARADGKSINALSSLQLDGKSWQQWSRHRNPTDWRSGIDNIETHLLYVTAFLDAELKKP